eukprot:5209111-Ditylum_brightwellii.AAC.1
MEDTVCCLNVKLLKYILQDGNKIPIVEGVKQPLVNSLFSSPSICNSDGIPHLYKFKDIIIVEKDSNVSNCQHDNHNSSVQTISKSKDLECFDMDKSNGKEDDNVVIEEVAVDDFSDESEDHQGRHLDKFGYKETLQARDTIRYTKSNGIAGRK